ncbi:camphor resistance protein CrcB [Breoghania corrubedonensis]|uniref:Fluoride-specific ion channel FluC n=1 Tax=Breoghania corrubedonensis TaxID=665038 RepID=A0A2T5VCR8_9HYPH|nr:fluoride efflux transporter CrcB [Breoghania corrubedonensis]PTW61546.1 camphor resistance protein CrcB [Breoghania corrubedonensis]
MKHLLLVALGGGIGAAGRHLVGLYMMRQFGTGFPYGTLTVNVLGSFIMGLLIAILSRMDGSFQNVRLLVATGMLGGFTTFSSFSLDFATIWERGHMELALGYMLITVVASIGALFAALWLVRGLAG